MNSKINISIENLNETKKFAHKFSKFIKAPFFVCLNGELGTGKTTFARYLINELSSKKIKVLSPTFPILQIYNLKKINVWHYDLYRINNEKEYYNLDFDIALNDLVIVEWPDIFRKYLPKSRVEIMFHDEKNNQKKLTISFFGKLSKIRDKLCKILKKK